MTGRITLALLFIVPAAMAYPWSSTTDQWLLGVAAGAVLILFAWWRGLFVTTIIGRRLAMWGRRHHRQGAHQSSEYTTILMRLEPSGETGLPLGLLAGYVHRYGIRCDKVRITNRDIDGDRTTWIAVTLGASDNLAALRARSPRIPLRDTAEVVGRRLADHLREVGWSVTIVDDTDTPVPVSAKETWRGLRDGAGYVSAYRVTVGDRLPETLAAIRAYASETWAALEITGTATDPRVAASCTVRTAERPRTTTPIPGLQPLRGRHGPALHALNPLSTERLESTPAPFAMNTLQWPVDSAVASRT